MNQHCGCGAMWNKKLLHCQFCHRTWRDLLAFITHEHTPEDDARWDRDKHGRWGTPASLIDQGELL